jgi:hypothetical protein
VELLVDVDVLAKLAHWRLLPELPAFVGFEWAQMSTVASLRFRAQRATTAPDGKLFHNADAACAAVDALALMAPLPTADPTRLAAFQDATDIDAGEAILFALLDGVADRYVLTGDKRAVRALSHLPSARRALLQGRLLVLESVFMRVLDLRGIEWLRERVCPSRHLDKTIAIALGSQCDAPLAAVHEALHSYYGELAVLCTPCLLRALGAPVQ